MRFIDLAAQQAKIREELERRIGAVLDHGAYVMGPEIDELETRLASYVGVSHAIACASGTDALLMALMAFDVQPGHAILTTPFTFVATAEVVALLGATPVFLDIDPRTFNLDPERLGEASARAAARGLEPRGIIAVDLFGLPADYDAIERFAAGHGMFVVEDAAQSFGASRRGRRAGSRGAIGATSFFPAKPLGCYGDGGALFTGDDGLAERLRSIRNHGQGHDRYHNVRVGINGRLDTLQAAVLLAKLGLFDDELDARGRVARRYSEGLAGAVEVPVVPGDARSAWAQYSVLTDRRDAVRETLGARGIPTAIYYPVPLHLQPAFSGLGHAPGDFPVAEETAARIVSLPMHPYLGIEDQARVVEAVRAAAER